jgi:hypothetical protein
MISKSSLFESLFERLRRCTLVSILNSSQGALPAVLYVPTSWRNTVAISLCDSVPTCARTSSSIVTAPTFCQFKYPLNCVHIPLISEIKLIQGSFNLEPSPDTTYQSRISINRPTRSEIQGSSETRLRRPCHSLPYSTLVS